MRIPLQISSLVEDVIDQYVIYRKNGDSRDIAISKIKDLFQEELADTDNAALVYIGLVLTLCKKKELTKEIAAEATISIQNAIKLFEENRKISSYMRFVLTMLNKPEVYGIEARYSTRHTYIPDWQIGDLFIHPLVSPQAKKVGILGDLVLMYKVGEYWNNPMRLYQLMWVSVCKQDRIPTTQEQLEEVHWLRMLPEEKGWSYSAQIFIKNKQDEDFFSLKKIGHFTGITPPADIVTESPFVSRPLFGRINKEDIFPDFEAEICLLHKLWGYSTGDTGQGDEGQGDGSVVPSTPPQNR